MRVMATIFIFLFSLEGFCNEVTQVFCNVVNQPQYSELRVLMEKEIPSELALREPLEENFRPQDMIITNILGSFDSSKHSFMAKPNITPEMIDWSKETGCYKHVDTQWHFVFDYEADFYYVQLMPYFVKEYNTCVTPRVPPMNNQLTCYW